ncbi:MAG: DnaJ domain-containing protein [Bacteroidales bacterium]|nr:DnaJ domain-containing protein [Bacteroidales bacterium]
MREYLKKRKERFDSQKSAQIGCLFSLIVFFLLAFLGSFDKEKTDDISDPTIFLIIAILFIIMLGIFLTKIRLRKTETATLQIIISFLKESNLDNNEIKSRIRKIFSMYSLEKIDKHLNTYLLSNLNINETCHVLSNQSVDIKYFLLYSLLDIAANDAILTIDEENFITRIRKGINIHEITYNNIKNNYLKKGLQEERKIIEEQKRKETAKKFSKAFLPYNAYKILGVSPTVTKAQLKKVYRTLAKKYHPDKYHGQNEEVIQQAEDKFQEILEAYEIVLKYKIYN